MKEEWRVIDGYKGLYEVSNFGRVKSLFRIVKRKDKTNLSVIEKILKDDLRNGYPYINLSINNEVKKFSIHRLVAQAFIPNKESKPQVNHINEIRTDNRVENLEWVTHSENLNHGTGIARSVKKQSIKVNQLTLSGDLVKVWNSMHEAQLNGFDQGVISKCCAGKKGAKTHKGFKWGYFKNTLNTIPEESR